MIFYSQKLETIIEKHKENEELWSSVLTVLSAELVSVPKAQGTLQKRAQRL